ncbi:MAG: prepilin-type N-terminal cleavage/methylation domain-containing protein [Pseudomonas sp.]|nr:prepilin-type N-terminal cleavage/methylation domain-containing protein [Stutzerimonas stutzeri]MEB2326587.1 prepilin-type N-terminal cleavage/methylation domain-containing protein [Pseudomonas sp.]
MHLSKKNGFSILEIIITLAIISILSAIALPILGEYRNKSNDITAQADVNSAIQIIRTSVN